MPRKPPKKSYSTSRTPRAVDQPHPAEIVVDQLAQKVAKNVTFYVPKPPPRPPPGRVSAAGLPGDCRAALLWSSHIVSSSILLERENFEKVRVSVPRLFSPDPYSWSGKNFHKLSPRAGRSPDAPRSEKYAFLNEK